MPIIAAKLYCAAVNGPSSLEQVSSIGEFFHLGVREASLGNFLTQVSLSEGLERNLNAICRTMGDVPSEGKSIGFNNYIRMSEFGKVRGVCGMRPRNSCRLA